MGLQLPHAWDYSFVYGIIALTFSTANKLLQQDVLQQDVPSVLCRWSASALPVLCRNAVVAAGLKLGMVFHQHDVVAAGVGRGSATWSESIEAQHMVRSRLCNLHHVSQPKFSSMHRLKFSSTSRLKLSNTVRARLRNMRQMRVTYILHKHPDGCCYKVSDISYVLFLLYWLLYILS